MVLSTAVIHTPVTMTVKARFGRCVVEDDISVRHLLGQYINGNAPTSSYIPKDFTMAGCRGTDAEACAF